MVTIKMIANQNPAAIKQLIGDYASIELIADLSNN